MAAYDIMPFRSSLGGTYNVRHAGFTAAETFDVGEVVGVDGSGVVVEMPIDESPVVVGDAGGAPSAIGIACHGPGSGNLHPDTGVAYAANDRIAYWPFTADTEFITDNFMNTGMTAAVTPLVTDIGEAYQISYSTAAPIGWGVEQTVGAAGDVIAQITDVLDINKAPIRLSGGTGVYLVFEAVVTQA